MKRDISIKEVFADNLGEFIADSDLSGKEIADRLNTSATTISRWKRGVDFPSPEHIEVLAIILKVDFSDFFMYGPKLDPDKKYRRFFPAVLRGENPGERPRMSDKLYETDTEARKDDPRVIRLVRTEDLIYGVRDDWDD